MLYRIPTTHLDWAQAELHFDIKKSQILPKKGIFTCDLKYPKKPYEKFSNRFCEKFQNRNPIFISKDSPDLGLHNDTIKPSYFY